MHEQNTPGDAIVLCLLNQAQDYAGCGAPELRALGSRLPDSGPQAQPPAPIHILFSSCSACNELLYGCIIRIANFERPHTSQRLDI